MRRQLETLRHPHLLVLDTFEHASPELSQWLESNVLARLPDYPALRVVVCGQKVPQAQGQFWQDDAHTLALSPIKNPTAWHACYQHVPVDFIQNLINFTQGDPALISQVLNGSLQQGRAA